MPLTYPTFGERPPDLSGLAGLYPDLAGAYAAIEAWIAAHPGSDRIRASEVVAGPGHPMRADFALIGASLHGRLARRFAVASPEGGLSTEVFDATEDIPTVLFDAEGHAFDAADGRVVALFFAPPEST